MTERFAFRCFFAHGIMLLLLWTSAGGSVSARALPQLVIQGTTIDDRSGGNGDRFIDPGETIALTITVKNNGTTAATRVSGVLSVFTPGVSVITSVASYPDIPAGTSATNTAPFVFSVNPAVPRGTTLTFRLFLVSNEGTFQESFTLRILQLIVTTFTSSDVPRAIPDGGLVGSNLLIPSHVTIFDLDVELNITHTADADLAVFLISPANTIVRLFGGVGGFGNNFINTVLDDEATIPITAGSAPFTGRFQPEQPLSVFDGESSFGVWTLVIRDSRSGNTGALISWRLVLSSEAPPTRKTLFASTDVPKDIVEFQSSPPAFNPTITSRLVISEALAIADLDVRVTIVHPNVSELEIALVAPDGTRVLLMTGIGGGANVTDTIFDDEAPTPISGGSAPYRGRFRPQGSLARFDSLASAAGVWVLEVKDTSFPPNNIVPGRLLSWDVAITTASPGISRTPYESTAVPVRINEAVGSPPVATSTVTIADSVTITDLDVQITIYHNRVSDLEVALVGPDGTRVVLLSGSASGANLIDTILDDSAAQPIGAGSAPHTGRFRPSSPLSVFNGKNSLGTWRLEVRDRQFNFIEGDLIFWQLIITHT